MKKFLFSILLFTSITFSQTSIMRDITSAPTLGSGGYSIVKLRDTVRVPMSNFSGSAPVYFNVNDTIYAGVGATRAQTVFGGFNELWVYQDTLFHFMSSATLHGAYFYKYFQDGSILNLPNNMGSYVADTYVYNDTLYFADRNDFQRSLDGGRTTTILFTTDSTTHSLETMYFDESSRTFYIGANYPYDYVGSPGGVSRGYVYKYQIDTGIKTYIGAVSSANTASWFRGFGIVRDTLYALIDAQSDTTSRGIYIYQSGTTWVKDYRFDKHKTSWLLGVEDNANKRLWVSVGTTSTTDTALNKIYEYNTLLNEWTWTIDTKTNPTLARAFHELWFDEGANILYGMSAPGYTKTKISGSTTYNSGGGNYILYARIENISYLDSLEVLNASWPILAVGDTAELQWATSDEAQDFYISISYDNGTIFTIKDTVNGVASATLPLDTASNTSIIKVTSAGGDNAQTISFVIVPEQHLEITNLSIVDNIATVIVLSTGITSWTLYADEVDTTGSWTYTIGSKGVVDSLTTDTLIVALPHLVAPYFKVEEVGDTAVYGLSSVYYGKGSLVTNPSIICYTWFHYGTGARWIRDVSCGWVGNITIEYGISTLSIVDDYLTITPTVEGYPWPYDPPVPSIADGSGSYVYTSAASGFISLGREYYIEDAKLYQKDLTNSITYMIADFGSYDAGTLQMSDSVGITRQGDHLLVANLPGSGLPIVHLFTALDAPYDPATPLVYDIWTTEQIAGTIINVTRNYFRGVDPKAEKR